MEPRKYTYHPLSVINEFWENKDHPVTAAEFAEFERKHGIVIPMLLKNLFSISNGGTSEHSHFQANGQYLCMFPEWIPPIKEWEPFSQYVDSFGLDDDESLTFKKDFPDAFISYRHGFDVFSLFWNSPDPTKSIIGVLDMNAPVGAPDRFAKLTVSSDPTKVFFRADEKK